MSLILGWIVLWGMITVFWLDFCKTFSVPNKFEDTLSYALNQNPCEIGCVIVLAIFHHLPPHSLSSLTQVVSHMRGHTPTLLCLTWFLTQMRGHTYKVCHVWPNLYPKWEDTYKVYPVWPELYLKWEDTYLQSVSCLTQVLSQMRGHTPTKPVLFVLSCIPNERTHTYKVYPVWPKFYPKREDTHLQSLKVRHVWLLKFNQVTGHTPVA